MDNLKRPASPQPIAFSGDNTIAQTTWGVHEDFAGFTKLEIASLMIAQGLVFRSGFPLSQVVLESGIIAKAVLEAANK